MGDIIGILLCIGVPVGFVVGYLALRRAAKKIDPYGLGPSFLDLLKSWDCPQPTQMQKPFSSYNNAYNEGYIHGMSVGQQFHHHRNNFPQ